MFDPVLKEGETYMEDKKDDGTVVKTRRIKHLPRGHVSFDQTEDVQYVETEGPERVETTIQDEEEILDDGTVHKTHTVKRHSIKHVRKSLRSDAGEEDIVEDSDVEVPGTGNEKVTDVYEEPPKKVIQFEEETETLDDGTKVKRQVVMSSMIHKIRTRTKSFDEGTGKELVAEEEMDEVVPGTQSCFIARSDSSSSSSSYIDDLDEMEATIEEEDETLVDGTFIKTMHLTATEKRKTHSRSGSIDESEDTMDIREKRITPAPSPTHTPPCSPRSGSPLNVEDLAARIAEKTIRTAHFESVTHKHGGEVESTSEYQTDEFLPKEQQPPLLLEEEKQGKCVCTPQHSPLITSGST